MTQGSDDQPDHARPDHTLSEATDLFDLQRTYADKYRIEFIDGIWRAYRLGDALRQHTAESAVKLRFWLHEDHQEWIRESRRHKQ